MAGCKGRRNKLSHEDIAKKIKRMINDSPTASSVDEVSISRSWYTWDVPWCVRLTGSVSEDEAIIVVTANIPTSETIRIWINNIAVDMSEVNVVY